MTNEELDQIRAIVREAIAATDAKVDRIAVDIVGIKSDIAGLKSDVAGLKSDVAGLKSDVNRATARADDVMSGQTKIATDIAVIRDILSGEIRQDLDDLRGRVEALEAQRRD